MSKDLLELFTADELTQVPPYVHMVTDRQKLREQLSEYVQANYKLTSKAEFTEDAWRWCAIPGTRPQDFLYRLLEVVPDRWIMASIRFRRHNVRKPFVEIVHKTFPILQRSDLVRVYDRVFDSYKVFKPINIRLYDPGSGLLSMTREAELEWDFRYYGATVRGIIQNGSYTNGLSLRLERTSHISFYEEYCNIYKKLATQNNLYGPEGVWFETRERLEAALEERGLFSIIINGHWAGVIALRRRVEKFLAGVCIVEIVLREKFRGRGYGPLVQRAAVTELALGDNEIVFGHIMDANKPAVNTALRVGRQPLGGYTFVRLV